MPELPEVETVRRRLRACLLGMIARDVIVHDATVSQQGEVELRARLTGTRVCDIRRRGKYLIFEMGDAETGIPRVLAVVHLRMTGQLLFRREAHDRAPRFTLLLDPDTELHFVDVRRFGRLWTLEPGGEGAFFAGMGPEPLGDDFDVACLRRALAGRKAPLKSVLLDQRRVAGIGNIYADEALFRARLHPLRAAGSVGPREARRLHAALRETLQAGIDHEGSSIESFVDPAGRRGSFQETLNVYQRTGRQCRVCGALIHRLEVGGRGTHYCPVCQPRRGGMAPRSRRRRGSPAPPRGGRPPSGAAGN
jgi:formamidopyrimidine-DNA glycosylase